MQWLFAHFYIFLWIAAALVLVVGLVRMLSRTIIGKGEFSRLLLYVVTIATAAAFFTKQLDDAIRFCTKILLVAEALAIIFDLRKRR
ncbi:hypothetical protein SAMN05421771_0215 [Granulicella pectinivorans]|jgi:hypothetical protein|uniref:Uncharacterized protein n=1 Tax=Granulicella pectinivorans TaxID=474950 RepID=A0A1I6L3N0_9BACT|nr:hypothetical protein [Granulicella pectinivorans]SFR98085.1 hypothetical protein SAMN05421771_0215 [Granulicella pectinivorans]